jgi:hypothetical protein
MSMPTGSKFKNGYATVSSDFGGMEYRVIAEKMAEGGDEISVSTARNLVLRALEKIAREVCILQGVAPADLDEESKRVSLDPRFQESMASMLDDIYAETA